MSKTLYMQGRDQSGSYSSTTWLHLEPSGMCIVGHETWDAETAEIVADARLFDTIQRRVSANPSDGVDINDFIDSL